MVLSAQKQARPAFSGRSVQELDQLIKDRLACAVRALETGQPNLASLYMKRALEHIAERRTLLALQRLVRIVVDFCSDLADRFLDALAPAFRFFENLARSISKTGQGDFVLAAPR